MTAVDFFALFYQVHGHAQYLAPSANVKWACDFTAGLRPTFHPTAHAWKCLACREATCAPPLSWRPPLARAWSEAMARDKRRRQRAWRQQDVNQPDISPGRTNSFIPIVSLCCERLLDFCCWERWQEHQISSAKARATHMRVFTAYFQYLAALW